MEIAYYMGVMGTRSIIRHALNSTARGSEETNQLFLGCPFCFIDIHQGILRNACLLKIVCYFFCCYKIHIGFPFVLGPS